VQQRLSQGARDARDLEGVTVTGLELASTAGGHDLRHIAQSRELWCGQEHITVTLKGGEARLKRNETSPLSAVEIGGVLGEGRGNHHRELDGTSDNKIARQNSRKVRLPIGANQCRFPATSIGPEW
jgi:hypothetical protein